MKSPRTIQLTQLENMPAGSDLALKKNVSTLQSALEKILALRPVTWHWKTDTRNQQLNYGFIAQEVEQLFPDLVSSRLWQDGTDKKHIDATGIIPYAIAAMQEQQRQITDMRQELAEIRTTIDQLKR